MSQKSLSSLVAIYRCVCGPRIAAYLNYFVKLPSLDDAIRFACHGKDGEIHDHQHLVGKVKLEQARKVLQRHADEITACESYDELLKLIEKRTSGIDRFGVLAIYDTRCDLALTWAFGRKSFTFMLEQRRAAKRWEWRQKAARLRWRSCRSRCEYWSLIRQRTFSAFSRISSVT